MIPAGICLCETALGNVAAGFLKGKGAMKSRRPVENLFKVFQESVCDFKFPCRRLPFPLSS
jgi:hypothetical protein